MWTYEESIVALCFISYGLVALLGIASLVVNGVRGIKDRMRLKRMVERDIKLED